jgi:DNA polymerase-3 subunit delta
VTPIEKALKSGLILLCGDEDLLRRRALNQVLEGAGTGPEDLDYQAFDGQSSHPRDWIAAAGTVPFLADRRTVVVRHLLLCDVDGLKGLSLAGLPPSSLLVLVADEESGADDRQQRMKTARKNWEKAVQSASGVVLSFEPDQAAARSTIKDEVAKSGKSLAPRGAEVLLDMCGGSLSRALEELEKLLLFVGASESIAEREIRQVVVPSREWNVFKMTDAIVSDQVPEALRQLKTLMGNATKADDAIYRQILPMLSRSLRLLWQARICLDAGCNATTAPPEVRRCFPDRPDLSKEQPYRQGQVIATARRTTLDRIARALEVLSDTDARLKGALPGFSSLETMERMILELASVLSAGPSVSDERAR